MKKTLIYGLFALLAFALTAPSVLAQENTKEFKGFLYEVLDAIGTEDESPLYLLEQFDGTDLVVLKKSAQKNKEDSYLREYLEKKVTITGKLMGQSIDYQHIYNYEP